MKEFIDKLISRLEADQPLYVSKAIKIVNELAEEYINTSTEHINCSTDTSTDCSTKVSEMPTGWIPCSERLPEYTDEYNVTVDVASEFGCYKTVKTLRFERIKGKEPKWAIPQDEIYRVLAWCELPAPYTEGE